jgi:hypothetical protein
LKHIVEDKDSVLINFYFNGRFTLQYPEVCTTGTVTISVPVTN